MRRSISTLLGVTAAAGIVALGVPALASPAAASTTTKPKASAHVDDWGPIYARNGLASAKGFVRDEWIRRGRTNLVTVSGRLTDRDFRTFRRGGKCAYVSFQVRRLGSWRWQSGPSYTWCGADKPPRYFSFTRNHVRAVKARVCQVDRRGGSPFACSGYRTVYWARR